MTEDEFFEKLDSKEIRFITIEIIQNGFVVTLPEYAGKDQAKFHRLSLDGVNRLMKRIWEDKKLVENTVKIKSDIAIDKKKGLVKAKKAKKK